MFEEPKLYTQINGLSNDTSSIAFLANDDFCMFHGNIVFCHIEKTENNKERMFYNIPVKLNAESEEHLLCNKDGSPIQLRFSRKGTKFLSHNLDNAVLYLNSANEFGFISDDNIFFHIKYEQDEKGQYQYFYQTSAQTAFDSV